MAVSTKRGTLFLLPNLLSTDSSASALLPPRVQEIMKTVDGLISESAKGSRLYLSHFQTKQPLHRMPFAVLNKNTPKNEFHFLLEPLFNNENWGLICDAGLPCLADPGAALVAFARKHHVPIEAVSGPSSITLAIMLSGIESQRFSFQGYLPKEPALRTKTIDALEKRSRINQELIICMEAPHRNAPLLQTLINTLQPTTQLCIASNITSPSEWIESQSVDQWKKRTELPQIHRQPTLFLFRAHSSHRNFK